MKKLFFLAVLMLAFPACINAGPVTFLWDVSIDDAYLGTGGYRLYVGQTSGNLAPAVTVSAGVTTLTHSLPPGNYIAAMTAFDINGLESVKTEELSFPVIPGRPNRFRLP
jgi:hypothetical protein